MSKIALITDTHFGIRNDNPQVRTHIANSFQWFFESIKDKDIKAIIHLGDLYDRRKYIQYPTAYACRTSFLEPAQALGVPVHIISGNHDVYHTNTNFVNSLTEMVGDRYSNIKYYLKPQEIEIAGTHILLLPWIDESNSEQSYAALSRSKATLVMAHLELNGFEMHKGTVMDHGMDIPDLGRYSYVYSGHYHHKSSRDNIHYLGAFADYSWSDFADPRGFHFLDLQTLELEYVRNPNVIHIKTVYDDVNTDDILNHVQSKDYSEYANKFVQVVCATRNNPYAWDLFMENLSKVGPLDISVVQDISEFKDLREDELVDEAEDTMSILDTYISHLTLPVEQSTLKKFFREIYSEAISIEHVE